jgi:hypothetical protein
MLDADRDEAASRQGGRVPGLASGMAALPQHAAVRIEARERFAEELDGQKIAVRHDHEISRHDHQVSGAGLGALEQHFET